MDGDANADVKTDRDPLKFRSGAVPYELLNKEWLDRFPRTWSGNKEWHWGVRDFYGVTIFEPKDGPDPNCKKTNSLSGPELGHVQTAAEIATTAITAITIGPSPLREQVVLPHELSCVIPFHVLPFRSVVLLYVVLCCVVMWCGAVRCGVVWGGVVRLFVQFGFGSCIFLSGFRHVQHRNCTFPFGFCTLLTNSSALPSPSPPTI